MSLDTKQVELIATSWLEMQLLQQGYEVARPLRDKGIDLIAYRDDEDHVFSATPIQVKSARKRTFSIERKYANRGIVMAYIWEATSGQPELFLVPYDDAVDLLGNIGDALNSASWLEKGGYSSQAPSKKLCDELEKYRNHFSGL